MSWLGDHIKGKWEKVKQTIGFYNGVIEEADKRGLSAKVNVKQLEKDTEFLVHVFMMYELLRPYLKGFYLKIKSLRYNQGDYGWKYGKCEWEELAVEFWQDGE